jgi:hypothetical protein
LQTFIAAWNGGDVERIVALFADDAVITDDFVVIDPQQPAGSRTFRGLDEIRRFVQIAAPGFHADVTEHEVDADAVRFAATVSADGLRRRGIDRLDQVNELAYEGGKVKRFAIHFTAESQARLREAAARQDAAGAP